MWALDLGRLVAAALVFAGHASLFFDGPLWVSVAPSALSWFFVLSGFVLASIYPSLQLDATSLREFYLRRFVRIYPLYLVACLFGFAVLWFGNPALTRAGLGTLGIPGFSTFDLPESLGNGFLSVALAKTLFFVTTFDAHSTLRYLVNGPLWSIYCEVFFYLLFPLLLVAMRRLQSPLQLWLLAGVLWLVQFAVILFVTHGQIGPAAEWTQIHATLYTNPLARLPEFMVGIALALARQRSVWRPSVATLLLVGVIAAALLVVCLNLGSLESMRPLGLYWLVVPANAVLIAMLALLPKASASLEASSVRLGLLSYAVYSIHWPVLELGFLLQGRLGLPVSVVLLGAALVVFLGGWLVVSLYETPSRRKLYALFRA